MSISIRETCRRFYQWSDEFDAQLKLNPEAARAWKTVIAYGCDEMSVRYALFAFSSKEEVPMTRLGYLRKNTKADIKGWDKLRADLIAESKRMKNIAVEIREFRRTAHLLGELITPPVNNPLDDPAKNDPLDVVIEGAMAEVDAVIPGIEENLKMFRKFAASRYDVRNLWIAGLEMYVATQSEGSAPIKLLKEMLVPAFSANHTAYTEGDLAKIIRRVKTEYLGEGIMESIVRREFPVKILLPRSAFEDTK